jgi:hypothetical protein
VTNVDKALLLSEWVIFHTRGLAVEACPVCIRLEKPPTRKHDPGCAMDLALAERGWGTQEERDRARYYLVRGEAATAPTLPPSGEDR